MGWAFCGQDEKGRDIGYGVKAKCDHLGCAADIDRGLGCVCGGMHGGDGKGCGGYFCGAHLSYAGGTQLCEKCAAEVPDEDEDSEQ
jgi:hypothetical protein